jgi:hypothetical protein
MINYKNRLAWKNVAAPMTATEDDQGLGSGGGISNDGFSSVDDNYIAPVKVSGTTYVAPSAIQINYIDPVLSVAPATISTTPLPSSSQLKALASSLTTQFASPTAAAQIKASVAIAKQVIPQVFNPVNTESQNSAIINKVTNDAITIIKTAQPNVSTTDLNNLNNMSTVELVQTSNAIKASPSVPVATAAANIASSNAVEVAKAVADPTYTPIAINATPPGAIVSFLSNTGTMLSGALKSISNALGLDTDPGTQNNTTLYITGAVIVLGIFVLIFKD